MGVVRDAAFKAVRGGAACCGTLVSLREDLQRVRCLRPARHRGNHRAPRVEWPRYGFVVADRAAHGDFMRMVKHGH